MEVVEDMKRGAPDVIIITGGEVFVVAVIGLVLSPANELTADGVDTGDVF